MRKLCLVVLCTGLLGLIAGGRGEEPQEVFWMRRLPAERVVVAQGGYFPKMLQLDDGELLVTCKTGAAHVGKGGRASLVRSRDGGRTWSQPVTVFDLPDADDSTDALGVLPDGTLLFAAVSYTWKGERYSDEGWRADTYLIQSRDRGRTWSQPIKVNTKPYTWAYPYGRIVTLKDRSILISCFGGYLPKAPEDSREGLKKLLASGKKPVKPESQRGNFAFIVRSRDGGRTWSVLSNVAQYYNEITLHLLDDGRLLAVTRSDEGGHLSTTFSSDNGVSWSSPKQITADREHPGDLLRLSNGDILLSYGERNKPYGVQAMVSRDGGQSWNREHRILLSWDGDQGDLGYPISVQRKDGKIVTVYYVVYGERDSTGSKGVAPKNAYTKAIIWELPKF